MCPPWSLRVMSYLPLAIYAIGTQSARPADGYRSSKQGHPVDGLAVDRS